MSDALTTAWGWLQGALAWIVQHHLSLPILLVSLAITAWAYWPERPRRPLKGRPLMVQLERQREMFSEEWDARKAAFARHGLTERNWVKWGLELPISSIRRNDALRATLVLALKGRTDQALRRFSKIAAQLKGDTRPAAPGIVPGAWLNVAQTIYMGGALIGFFRDDATALPFCEKARACGPERLEILHPLGFLLLKAGRASEAVAVFERAVVLHKEAEPLLYKARKEAPGVAGVDAHTDLMFNEQGLAEALAWLEEARKAASDAR